MFNLADAFHRAGVLQEHFRVVPDEYLGLPAEGKQVRVNCVCGVQTDLRPGELHTCDCGRLFWNGSKVYAAPPADPPVEHECQPERLTLPDATIVLADYCGICKADLG